MGAPRRYSTERIAAALEVARSCSHASAILGISLGALRKRCQSGADSAELAAPYKAAIRRGKAMVARRAHRS